MKYAIKRNNGTWWTGQGWTGDCPPERRKTYRRDELPLEIDGAKLVSKNRLCYVKMHGKTEMSVAEVMEVEG